MSNNRAVNLSIIRKDINFLDATNPSAVTPRTLGVLNGRLVEVIGGGGGEVNTAANLGAGAGLYATKVGVELRFKSLLAGTNVTLTPTGDDITINATGGSGEINTASNVGAGSGVFASKAGLDLQFKSLTAGTNITLTPSGTEIQISAAGGGGGGMLRYYARSTAGQEVIVVASAAGVTAAWNGTTPEQLDVTIPDGVVLSSITVTNWANQDAFNQGILNIITNAAGGGNLAYNIGLSTRAIPNVEGFNPLNGQKVNVAPGLNIGDAQKTTLTALVANCIVQLNF